MNGTLDRMKGGYLGPTFEQNDIEQRLAAAGAKFEVLGGEDLIGASAQSLAEQKALGWFQGRMEFGPRALGSSGAGRGLFRNRLRQSLHVAGGRRGPATEKGHDCSARSAVWNRQAQRRTIGRPSGDPVDYSARIQTVRRDTNPRCYALLKQFESTTGCSVVINTSFNGRGEPIVGSPEDAFRCFMGTEIERFAIGNCWIEKEHQNPALRQRYESNFELD